MNTAFSLIVPTRGRTAQLRVFLDSAKRTARRPDEIEVILVIDHDDPESLAFDFDGLRLKKVQVPPGLTMGALNTAGYNAAAGEYLMLLNDDVIVRTPFWDEHIIAAFRSYPDGIALVHVNDLTFNDTLCIFPCITREFRSIAGRPSPEEYRRYRIDDHIHNIFDLLTLLGHKRRLFLPGVVFEHMNVQLGEHSSNGYVPDRAIHEIDSRQFDALLPERKKIALAAMHRIADHSRSGLVANWQKRLDQITHEDFIRLPQHARWLPEQAGKQPRVTIGVVSADSSSAHAVQCLNSIRKYTVNYELIVLDNAGDPEFNHSREMNRLLSICRTDYLVLMDDDVFVQPGWLEGMLRGIQPDVGVVTPRHRNAAGELVYGGIVINPEDSGRHTHIVNPGGGLQRIQTMCSAIVMIDMAKCGHLRFDERYTKYFLDIDYGLRVWEQGFQVVCSASPEVTHLAGATLTQRSVQAKPFWDAQIQLYRETWVDSGRIAALRKGIWKQIPEINWITTTGEQIDQLVADPSAQDAEQFQRRAAGLIMSLEAYPALKDYLRAKAGDRMIAPEPEPPPVEEEEPVIEEISEPLPVIEPAHVNGEIKIEVPAPVMNGHDLDEVRSRVEQLRERVNAAEADVSNIYQSRTWKALTKTAGLLQRRR